jgi:hypothetical protein
MAVTNDTTHVSEKGTPTREHPLPKTYTESSKQICRLKRYTAEVVPPTGTGKRDLALLHHDVRTLN